MCSLVFVPSMVLSHQDSRTEKMPQAEQPAKPKYLLPSPLQRKYVSPPSNLMPHMHFLLASPWASRLSLQETSVISLGQVSESPGVPRSR